MYRYPFAVGEDVYCVWEYDLPDRNERFLASVDPEYFGHIAERHVDELVGENRLRAAVALRGAYHHGLETLFSLLGALTQAPECVPAWLPKCNTVNLREIVDSLTHGRPLLTQRGRQTVTIELLSELVHSHCWVDEEPRGSTAARFAILWRRFSADLLDEHHINEYNSLKHGFRVASGGFVLRIGEEHTYGVSPPSEEMETVGGSIYGTTYDSPEPIQGSEQTKFHFRIRRVSLNWSAEAMIQRLQLLTFSLQNVVGALRCINGAPPGTISFHRPADPQIFDTAWQWHVGVSSINMDTTIDSHAVAPIARAELLQELEARIPMSSA